MSSGDARTVYSRGANDTEVAVLAYARQAGMRTAGWCAAVCMADGAAECGVQAVIEFDTDAGTDARCAQQCMQHAGTVVLLPGSAFSDEWLWETWGEANTLGRRVYIVECINDRIELDGDVAFLAAHDCAPWVRQWARMTFTATLRKPGRPVRARREYTPPGRSGLHKSVSM